MVCSCALAIRTAAHNISALLLDNLAIVNFACWCDTITICSKAMNC